jgi:hypothetical protein
VGTLASFDNTSLAKVEIYRYQSSLAFGTGTTFTEEVGFPQEYTKDWRGQIEYASSLSNGQFFVDYQRGRLIGKRADTTASETVTYMIEAQATATPAAAASNVNIAKLGNETLGDHDTAVIDHGIQPLYEAKDIDGSALPNAVAEGDAARPACTLNGVQIATLTNENGAYGAVSSHSQAISGGIGVGVVLAGIEAKEFDGSALPNDVTEGDAERVAGSLYGVVYNMITNEDGSGTPVIDHDTAIGTGLGVSTVMAGYEAKTQDGSALPNNVAEGDAIRPAATEYGVPYAMLVNADGSWTPLDSASQSLKTTEQSPKNQHYVPETLTHTNIANATPEFGYIDMRGYTDVSIHVEKTGGADTFDVDYECSNEGVDSSADWIDCTANGFQLVGGANLQSDHLVSKDVDLNCVGIRYEITTAGGANDADFNVFIYRWTR